MNVTLFHINTHTEGTIPPLHIPTYRVSTIISYNVRNLLGVTQMGLIYTWYCVTDIHGRITIVGVDVALTYYITNTHCTYITQYNMDIST